MLLTFSVYLWAVFKCENSHVHASTCMSYCIEWSSVEACIFELCAHWIEFSLCRFYDLTNSLGIVLSKLSCVVSTPIFTAFKELSLEMGLLTWRKAHCCTNYESIIGKKAILTSQWNFRFKERYETSGPHVLTHTHIHIDIHI